MIRTRPALARAVETPSRTRAAGFLVSAAAIAAARRRHRRRRPRSRSAVPPPPSGQSSPGRASVLSAAAAAAPGPRRHRRRRVRAAARARMAIAPAVRPLKESRRRPATPARRGSNGPPRKPGDASRRPARVERRVRDCLPVRRRRGSESARRARGSGPPATHASVPPRHPARDGPPAPHPLCCGFRSEAARAGSGASAGGAVAGGAWAAPALGDSSWGRRACARRLGRGEAPPLPLDSVPARRPAAARRPRTRNREFGRPAQLSLIPPQHRPDDCIPKQGPRPAGTVTRGSRSIAVGIDSATCRSRGRFASWGRRRCPDCRHGTEPQPSVPKPFRSSVALAYRNLRRWRFPSRCNCCRPFTAAVSETGVPRHKRSRQTDRLG